MLINLTVGDCGGDGHGRTEVVPYDVHHLSLVSRNSLSKLHSQGCEILGHKLERQCEDYEEYKLTPTFMAALRLHDIPVPEEMDATEFAELYLHIARLALPSLAWDRVEGENIDVGGYGLFFN